MHFEPTGILGVVLVDIEPITDDRGLFARTFCAEEFVAAGLDPVVAQCDVSFNRAIGTLRGMHFQKAPFGEAKLVRCVQGRIFDVAVDVRAGSPTFGRWLGWELEASQYRAVFLPAGIAHGFLTLSADSEVCYQMSVPYRPDAAAGFRWDDPDVGIAWPDTPSVMSTADRALPDLADVAPAGRS
jgi:dTDP-4-dehydrorhamnose 3,5-epimerase